MCGFLGYIGPGPLDEAVFRDVLSLSRHRGPDSTGVHAYGTDLYGFNRLAIQDLSETGNQPMVGDDGRRVLLFNGEVYNHMRLREKYAVTGCRGHGDTETLFHLFRSLGADRVIPELDGMFAICWADYDRGEVLLARDMAGIKPLYFHPGLPIVFGSQLNQVVRLPVGIRRELSRPNLADYLALGSMVAPDTVFRDIRQVMPGETVRLEMSTGKVIRRHRYHVFERASGASATMDRSDLEARIDASVRDQLVADVPVAAFMSGGIDSPVVNAFALRNKPDLRAYTFRNRYDGSLDESATANALSRLIGLPYENIDYDETDVQGVVNDHFRFMGEPCGDFSTIPTFFICRAARTGATVMLSGDGGDELFFGYARHLGFFRDGWMLDRPDLLRKGLAGMRKLLGGPKVPDAILYGDDLGAAYRAAQSSMRPQDIRRILGSERFSEASDEAFSVGRDSSGTVASVVTRADYYAYLQMVLRKVDMMSMASSVEVRVPYLSREVIELSSRYLPWIRTEADLKRPLKDIFGACFPGGRTFHRKIGFTLPMARLLNGPLKADVEASLCGMPLFGSESIDTRAVSDFVQAYLRKEHTDHQAVWHLYAWQKWAITNELVS